MKAEPGEVGGEARLPAGHAQVGRHRQAEPAANRGAVDGGDDRLLGTEQSHALGVKRRRPGSRPSCRFSAGAAVAGEIGAGAKSLALRGENQRAAIGLGVERLEGVGDLLDQRDVEIVVRRASELDQRHVARFLHGDIFERPHHGSPLGVRGAGALRCSDAPSSRLTISASTTDTPSPSA